MAEIEFHADLHEVSGVIDHSWEHTVGSCHAPLALRVDWQAQLLRCHKELGFRYVRFHGLLSDDVGVLTVQRDQLLYSFFNADQIIDFLLSIGMRPFVELSFMPLALASGRKTVFHYRGNVTPPRNYEAWAALISKLVRHWIDRYGAREVARWFFEVWNEPNLKAFWTGNQKDYFKLYEHTAKTIKKVRRSIQVGGPATAANEWISDFLDFCSRKSVPVDFVSTHHYPTDAFGMPGDDTEAQLAASRRSAMREQIQNVWRKAKGLPVFYTEWNTSSNPRDPLHDEPYAAAFVVKTALEANGYVKAYSFWTFSDIFEENYFPSVPFHGGFGLLTIHNIAKPSYRAFEILHRLGNRKIQVDGIHDTVDCWVVRSKPSIMVLLSNHALPRTNIETENVTVVLRNVSDHPRRIYLERIDESHANPKKLWLRKGAHDYLSQTDVKQLQLASELKRVPLKFHYKNKQIYFTLDSPPHSVAAVTIDF
jgi:xylan 1,4-beta-xylosidase